jgi:hypothetical protein
VKVYLKIWRNSRKPVNENALGGYSCKSTNAKYFPFIGTNLTRWCRNIYKISRLLITSDGHPQLWCPQNINICINLNLKWSSLFFFAPSSKCSKWKYKYLISQIPWTWSALTYCVYFVYFLNYNISWISLTYLRTKPIWISQWAGIYRHTLSYNAYDVLVESLTAWVRGGRISAAPLLVVSGVSVK